MAMLLITQEDLMRASLRIGPTLQVYTRSIPLEEDFNYGIEQSHIDIFEKGYKIVSYRANDDVFEAILEPMEQLL